MQAEVDELAHTLITTEDAQLFGANEFKLRALAHKLAQKNGSQEASVSWPQCGQVAAFHAHRPHKPTGLVGPIRYRRAHYLCRRCGKGLFPVDQQAGLAARHLTPGLEWVAPLAGRVADSFEKAAELVHEMAGVRLGESTVERISCGRSPWACCSSSLAQAVRA